MAAPFPTVFIRQALCCGPSKTIQTGSADPNGTVAGSKFSIYIQVLDDGTAFVWIKTTEAGNTGWV